MFNNELCLWFLIILFQFLIIFINCFSHLYNKYLLRSNYIPDIIIDIEWIVANRKVPLVKKLTVNLSTNNFRKLRKYIDSWITKINVHLSSFKYCCLCLWFSNYTSPCSVSYNFMYESYYSVTRTHTHTQTCRNSKVKKHTGRLRRR